MEQRALVSKEKYDNIKSKATRWREKAIKLADKVQKLEHLVQQLEEENEHNGLGENNELIELERENLELSKKLRRIDFDNEKALMKKDIEIERLNARLDHYKERYVELKDDFKMFKKSS